MNQSLSQFPISLIGNSSVTFQQSTIAGSNNNNNNSVQAPLPPPSDRNLVFVFRPHIQQEIEDQGHDPSVKRRLRVGNDPKAVPFCGDFIVRRITKQEVSDHFSEENQKSKHKARGASKKLIELLSSGTELPKNPRAAAASAIGTVANHSRLPTSLLELARQNSNSNAEEEGNLPNVGIGKGILKNNNNNNGNAMNERAERDLLLVSTSETDESGNNNNNTNNGSGTLTTAQRLSSALEQSLAEYERPKAGMVAVRCSPTQNKNFFRESYANDYIVIGGANTNSAPASIITPACKGTEKAILEFYKKHIISNCKSMWNGEDATIVLQTADHLAAGNNNNNQQQQKNKNNNNLDSGSLLHDSNSASNPPSKFGSGSNNSSGLQQLPPAPSQLIAALLFPEVPNAKEEQLDRSGLSRRGSIMLSRRGSMMGSRRGSFSISNNNNNASSSTNPLGLNAAALASLSTGSLQRRSSFGGGSAARKVSPEFTPNAGGGGTPADLQPPQFPHERHLLRIMLQDLLKEKKEREFPGVTTQIFVSVVMVEEPDDDGKGGNNKFETTSAASGATSKTAVKITVEDLLANHPRTSRFVGDWAGNVKDLEVVQQQASQQMQALTDAPSIEKMREDCKVLQMLRALDDADAEKLIEEFKKFDQDGNGVLDPTEIREFFMEAFGYWIVDDELEQFFKVADQDNSGTIDIPEFLALFEGQRPKKAPGALKTLKPPSSKLVEGLKALARIKRVKKADEAGMRPPTLTVSSPSPTMNPSSSIRPSSSSRQPESKILNMLHALDDHDAEKLISEFKKFDADGNSELDRTEIREFFMEAFSYWVTEEEMDAFFAIADTDGSGTIDIPEFLALFENKRDRRAFGSAKPLAGVTSAVSNQIKSGLDALARIKRIRQAPTSSGMRASQAAGKFLSLGARGRSNSMLGTKGLLSGAKIAYKHTNSTNPFEVGIVNMRMLNVVNDDDIEWLERRLASSYQKAFNSINPFDADFSSLAKPKGHWVINVSLCQTYSESCGLGLAPCIGTMRYFLLNSTTKRMNQINFELRRMLHSAPRSIYDKFPPDVDAQLQLDSLDSRGRLKKSVLNMVHLLRATLHQKKISRLVALVVGTERTVNASLGIMGNLMRTGIETTNLAYDKAVEDALVNLVALRMQLERERNDAHFAVEAFQEIQKSKVHAKTDINAELQKQTNAVYRQLKRAENLTAEMARMTASENPGGDGMNRHRSITFVTPASGSGSPRGSPPGGSSPRSRKNNKPSFNDYLGTSVMSNGSSSDMQQQQHHLSSSFSSLNNDFESSGGGLTGSVSNKEIGLNSQIMSEREKTEKTHSVRNQQLRDVEAVLTRAKERFQRAKKNVEILRTELPRKKSHYEFLLKNAEAEWAEEEMNLEKSKNEQVASWARANVEQRDARFALSVLPDVPDEDTVLEGVNRQATLHRQKAIDQQLAKCEEMRQAHQKRLGASKIALKKLQRVADIISGKIKNSDSMEGWEDDDDDEEIFFAKQRRKRRKEAGFSDSNNNNNNNEDDDNDDDVDEEEEEDQNKNNSLVFKRKPPASQDPISQSMLLAADSALLVDQDKPNQHFSPSFASPKKSDSVRKILRLQEQQQFERQKETQKQKSQKILPLELQGLDFDHRRELSAKTSQLFEASCLLFRVAQTCRNQNEEMQKKFDRGEFHEADVREGNRILKIQPPQTMLVAQLKTPPTCLQAVLKDALSGAFAALHQLGSTFGRNAALYHADKMKGTNNNNNANIVRHASSSLSQHQQFQQQQTSSTSSISVAPLKMTEATKRALGFVAQIRNDPSVKIELSDAEAEKLELLTFFSSNYDDAAIEKRKSLMSYHRQKSGVFFSKPGSAVLTDGNQLSSKSRGQIGSSSFHGSVDVKTVSSSHTHTPNSNKNIISNNNILVPTRPNTARITSTNLLHNKNNNHNSNDDGLNNATPRRNSNTNGLSGANNLSAGNFGKVPKFQPAVQGQWGRPVGVTTPRK